MWCILKEHAQPCQLQISRVREWEITLYESTKSGDCPNERSGSYQFMVWALYGGSENRNGFLKHERVGGLSSY